MIWTDADREAFVRRGPKLWEAVPETKPEAMHERGGEWLIDGSRLAPHSVMPDDLAAAFGLAVAELAKSTDNLSIGHDWRGPRSFMLNGATLGACRTSVADGWLVAAYRALYAVHGLEWEEVGDAD